MPLLDHFHAPLHPQRHWEAFHSRWASAIANALNADLLPPDYFAEPETHASGRVKIDVATSEAPGDEGAGPGLATATLPTRVWSDALAALSMPCVCAGGVSRAGVPHLPRAWRRLILSVRITAGKSLDSRGGDPGGGRAGFIPDDLAVEDEGRPRACSSFPETRPS